MRQKPNLKFRLSTMHGDINMLVAHALQNGLAGGVFVVPRERHIFFTQTSQRR